MTNEAQQQESGEKMETAEAINGAVIKTKRPKVDKRKS